MLRLALSMALCIFLFAAGCGRKGDLIPPEAIVPPPVTDLRVVQRGEPFELSWTMPGTGRSGVEAARFRVMRREVLPPGEDCPTCPYRQVGEVDLDGPGATGRRGNVVHFRDSRVSAGTTYQYVVVSIDRDGVPSPPSNAVRKKKLPPPPPSPLRVEATASELLLSWGFEPLPENALLIGYHVYRKSNGGPYVRLTPNPVANFRYRDLTVQPQIEYRYMVRAVSELEGQVIESAPSGEAGGRILGVE